jgi:hypothetical protein
LVIAQEFGNGTRAAPAGLSGFRGGLMRAVLDELQKQGLIDRFEITDEDGRLILSIETSQGKRIAARVKKALAARTSDERQPTLVMINCAGPKKRPLSRLDESLRSRPAPARPSRQRRPLP